MSSLCKNLIKEESIVPRIDIFFDSLIDEVDYAERLLLAKTIVHEID